MFPQWNSERTSRQWTALLSVLTLPILILYLSVSAYFSLSSLGLKKCIPMVCSTASNALQHLIWVQLLWSGMMLTCQVSPTASVPLSFYPPLIFITSPFFSLSATFSFILMLLACSLFCLPLLFALLLLLSFITSALQLFMMAQSYEKKIIQLEFSLRAYRIYIHVSLQYRSAFSYFDSLSLQLYVLSNHLRQTNEHVLFCQLFEAKDIWTIIIISIFTVNSVVHKSYLSHHMSQTRVRIHAAA